MQDHVSRLVGLERFEVKRVLEERDRLELEVELVARAGCYPRWGGRRSRSRTAPRARVRDLPIAGRPHPFAVVQASLSSRRLRSALHRIAPGAAAAPTATRLFRRAPRLGSAQLAAVLGHDHMDRRHLVGLMYRGKRDRGTAR
jgi:hypothetical protein